MKQWQVGGSVGRNAADCGWHANEFPPPFDSQRPFKPMNPLVRWSERDENLVAPDGTVYRHRAALWKNELYAVAVYDEQDGITHVTVQRLDGTPARAWRHLQQINNETCGPEREAIEIYPAQSRVLDLTNTTHLWVFAEGGRLPMGMVPLPQGLKIAMKRKATNQD